MRYFKAILLFCTFSLQVLLLSAQPADVPGDGLVAESDMDSVHVVSPDIDSTLTVSLLTCSPGEETYELYGHTALRVQSRRDTTDIIYNYGVFDFMAPHFVWRFILGECDYMLVGESFLQFATQYVYRGSWVMEQVLNLTPLEANRLSEALKKESRPENCVYRYNIFRSNCTTRARDIIESSIHGLVVYPARPRRNTFRSILHQYTVNHPWAREGNDMLLGEEVDTLITERDEMFAPLYLMNYVDSAIIDNGRGTYRNLVLERRLLIPGDPLRQQEVASKLFSFPLTPHVLWWLLLAVGFCLACYELKTGRICWIADAVLMSFQGLAGILLCFMALFSVHPGVASNWQVWVLNPIPLFFVYSVAQAERRGQSHVYHTFAAVVLSAFLLLYFIIPQDFSELALPVVLLLLSRNVVNLLVCRVLK